MRVATDCLGPCKSERVTSAFTNGYAMIVQVNSLQHPPAVAVQTLVVDQRRPADALVPLPELF